jgi:hypothetical protein
MNPLRNRHRKNVEEVEGEDEVRSEMGGLVVVVGRFFLTLHI